MEHGDPFTSITKLCQPTASQEDILRYCPLDREWENFAPFASSSPLTRIVMVTPPDSPDAVFHTPPENRNSSSDDQLRVELGDPSDRIKQVRVSDDEPQPQSKKIRVEFDVDETRETEPNVVVEMADSIGKTDVVQKTGDLLKDVMSKVDGNRSIAGGSGKAVHVREDENIRTGGCAGKRADDEYKNVAAFGKRRRLPASFMGDGTDFPPEPKSGLMDSLGLLKIIFAKENDDADDGCVDILETAKRRGITFPRPRWWPPEKK